MNNFTYKYINNFTLVKKCKRKKLHSWGKKYKYSQLEISSWAIVGLTTIISSLIGNN